MLADPRAASEESDERDRILLIELSRSESGCKAIVDLSMLSEGMSGGRIGEIDSSPRGKSVRRDLGAVSCELLFAG